MHKTPQLPSEVELFAAVQHVVRESIEKQIALGPDVPLPQLEAIIALDAREIARRLLQGSLDLRSQRERAAASPPPSMSPKARFRSVSRSMRSTLGLVELTRLSWTDGAAHNTVVPLDSTLNVVPERNTLAVRRKVAEHVADLSFDRALKRLREEGIAVAKRQAEQAIVAIAQDYHDFYAWGRSSADEPDVADETLLAMSLDSKGVRVIFEGLRPDTQREAVEKCANYLEQRGGTLRYVDALGRGMPIATGVIEGACRSLVQDRMGITGARWSVATAEAVLRVRALIASGHWEQYLGFHHQQEHTRNHSLYPLAEAA